MAKRSHHESLSAADVSRVVEMAWEDRTPFEAITAAYKLSEADVIKLMRGQLKRASFEVWRERVGGRRTKHVQKAPLGALRHKANNRRDRG
jgi:uncharacterized protein (TIGR03643 family)